MALYDEFAILRLRSLLCHDKIALCAPKEPRIRHAFSGVSDGNSLTICGSLDLGCRLRDAGLFPLSASQWLG